MADYDPDEVEFDFGDDDVLDEEFDAMMEEFEADEVENGDPFRNVKQEDRIENMKQTDIRTIFDEDTEQLQDYLDEIDLEKMSERVTFGDLEIEDITTQLQKARGHANFSRGFEDFVEGGIPADDDEMFMIQLIGFRTEMERYKMLKENQLDAKLQILNAYESVFKEVRNNLEEYEPDN